MSMFFFLNADLKFSSTFKVKPIPNFIEVVFSSCKGETDHYTQPVLNAFNLYPQKCLKSVALFLTTRG
jgi:hypothetical protein